MVNQDGSGVNWRIKEPETVPGNNANRFDTQRQSTETLGPNNPMADSGPPETGGDIGSTG